MLEKGLQQSWDILQNGANMGARVVKKAIKMEVKNNIISSKNLTPAHPAFCPPQLIFL